MTDVVVDVEGIRAQDNYLLLVGDEFTNSSISTGESVRCDFPMNALLALRDGGGNCLW